MSRNWRRGSSGSWRRVRFYVLERDRYRCKIAFPGSWTVRVRSADGSWSTERRRCLEVASCAHHTLGRSVTGDDPRYVVAACAPCNHRAGDPTRTADPPHTPRTRW